MMEELLTDLVSGCAVAGMSFGFLSVLLIAGLCSVVDLFKDLVRKS